MENINFLYRGVLLCLLVFPTLLLYKKEFSGLKLYKTNLQTNILIILICLYSLLYISLTHFIFNAGEGNWQRLWYVENYPLVSFWAITLLICVITPILEEAFFRGHLYNLAIKFKIPLPFWFVVTGIGWLLLHPSFGPIEITFSFIWGYMLSYLRHLSKSIIPNFIIHIGHNSLVWFQPAELQINF